MKHIVVGTLALFLAIGGLIYVTSQGGPDRDVPGKTTDAGKAKLGD